MRLELEVWIQSPKVKLQSEVKRLTVLFIWNADGLTFFHEERSTLAVPTSVPVNRSRRRTADEKETFSNNRLVNYLQVFFFFFF